MWAPFFCSGLGIPGLFCVQQRDKCETDDPPTHIHTDVLKEYGLTKLPPVPPKGGLYKRTLTVGTIVYVSGHGPLLESGP